MTQPIDKNPPLLFLSLQFEQLAHLSAGFAIRLDIEPNPARGLDSSAIIIIRPPRTESWVQEIPDIDQ